MGAFTSRTRECRGSQVGVGSLGIYLAPLLFLFYYWVNQRTRINALSVKARELVVGSALFCRQQVLNLAYFKWLAAYDALTVVTLRKEYHIS